MLHASKSYYSVSEEFHELLDILEETDNCMFITGRAGTGKSTLLNLFQKCTRKKVVALAPTGVAALHIKGQTIHSFFGFPPRIMRADDFVIPKNKYKFQRLDAIIIDEISMVRADVLDNIDYALRLFRDSTAPFGGVQMLFFGDLYQLPPVVASHYERQLFNTYYSSPYFYNAKVLEDEPLLDVHELRKVFRQEELHFLRLLEDIRNGLTDPETLIDLNERVQSQQNQDGNWITLTAHNYKANNINLSRLKAIGAPTAHFKSKVEGNFPNKLFPTGEILSLKVGAQVMLLKNDLSKRYVNGSLAKISRLREDRIWVRCLDDSSNEEIELEKHSWEMIRYQGNVRNIETKVLGTFTQFPLKLAWAITIHKSQGKTFERVHIDLGGGAFEHGQCYVALSRCRTLEGISLARPLQPKDILLDPRIADFYSSIRYL